VHVLVLTKIEYSDMFRC